MSTPKDEKKPKKLYTVKANNRFLSTRFLCLPPGLVTKVQFKDLKAGRTVKVEKLNPQYFEEVENGNS